jgi:hypothetical protein
LKAEEGCFCLKPRDPHMIFKDITALLFLGAR